MITKRNKTATIQMRVSPETKALAELVAENSRPAKSITGIFEEFIYREADRLGLTSKPAAPEMKAQE